MSKLPQKSFEMVSLVDPRRADSDSMFSLPLLERQLVMYISTEQFALPFDLESVPVVTKEEADAQALRALTEMIPVEAPSAAEKPKAVSKESGPIESGSQKYSQALSQVPEFKDFGALLKSSLKPAELTEKETEYAVIAVKHIFQNHIVLQVQTLPLLKGC
jgi:coatomer protein complex subunit gamma